MFNKKILAVLAAMLVLMTTLVIPVFAEEGEPGEPPVACEVCHEDPCVCEPAPTCECGEGESCDICAPAATCECGEGESCDICAPAAAACPFECGTEGCAGECQVPPVTCDECGAEGCDGSCVTIAPPPAPDENSLYSDPDQWYFNFNVAGTLVVEDNKETYTFQVKPGENILDKQRDYTGQLRLVSFTPVPHEACVWGAPVTTPATCTESGKTTSVCTIGGCIKEVTLPALGHLWGAYEETLAPTCVDEGGEARECNREGCDATGTKTIAVNPDAHDWSESVLVAATCTTDGYTEHICANSSEHNYQDATVEALGHSYDDGVVTRQPTYTQEGERTFTCQRPVDEGICGHSYTEPIPMLVDGGTGDGPGDGPASAPFFTPMMVPITPEIIPLGPVSITIPDEGIPYGPVQAPANEFLDIEEEEVPYGPLAKTGETSSGHMAFVSAGALIMILGLALMLYRNYKPRHADKN